MFAFALILFAAGLVLMTLAGKFNNKLERYNYSGTVRNFSIGAIVLAAILIFASFIRVVPAGHVGVVDIFGNVDMQQRQAGLNLVNPFANLIIMDIQTQEKKESMAVPSKEGLTMAVEISVSSDLDISPSGR